ncbi:hypothetical protein [Catellatospora methionotrophica]|uniref:hypothetical protein n=1 Tax=Catellatospora methionotrophica TaxID=121620 RepID=UPI00340C7507
MTAADRPAWAETPTDEYTLPQRIRDEHAPELAPREVPAWLLQPTGFYHAVIARIRESNGPQ